MSVLESLEPGDIVKEKTSNSENVYMVIELPVMMNAPGKLSQWKLYDVKEGRVIYRLLYDNDEFYEKVQ